MPTVPASSPIPATPVPVHSSRRAALRTLGSGGIATALLSVGGALESVAEASEYPRLLVEWAEAVSSGDPYRVGALFTNDGVMEDITFNIRATGRMAVIDHWATFFAAVPDYHVELRAAFKTGNWGVAEVTLTGTQLADFPGVPATGRSFEVRSASVFELRGNRIKRESDYYDLVKVLQDLGVL